MLIRLIASSILLSISVATLAGPKPIVLDPAYNHDRFETEPREIVREFRAFTVSFDSLDDDNGDGTEDAWGVPHWVSYHIKRFDGSCVPTRSRPSWFTDDDLAAQGIAPRDDTYTYSRSWRAQHPDWYERGHMAMKLIAERMGHDAAHNTHTLLNAVPQRKGFNNGIWKEMELLTAAWAQEYGDVWVITGPVIVDQKPSGWIGEEGEMKVAIPDALFKIVIKDGDSPDRPDVLAFLYPQFGPMYEGGAPYPHQNFLITVDHLEELTGLDFLTVLEDDVQREVESWKPEWLWAVQDANFLKACQR